MGATRDESILAATYYDIFPLTLSGWVFSLQGLPASAEGPVLLTLMREGGGLSKPGSTAEQPEPEPEEPSRSAGGEREDGSRRY